MEELKVLKSNALEAYNLADATGKSLLSNLLGKKHFVSDTKDLIKAFEDACDYNNTNPLSPRFTEGTISGNAMEMIAEIAKAMNRGRVMKGGEQRFYPVFEYAPSGFRFNGALSDVTYTYSGGGPRLCFANREDAAYAGQQFISLYDKFYNQ